MTFSITHTKTNNIPDWTQADMDRAAARYLAAFGEALYPAGSTIADITLSSDWNHDHTFSGTEVKNTFFAGPSSGADATPAFRQLAVADLTTPFAINNRDSGASFNGTTLQSNFSATRLGSFGSSTALGGPTTFIDGTPTTSGLYIYFSGSATSSGFLTSGAIVTFQNLSSNNSFQFRARDQTTVIATIPANGTVSVILNDPLGSGTNGTWSVIPSGMAIGNAVTAGTANSILYIDGSGNLAHRNPGFTYDGSTLKLRLNGTANILEANDGSGNPLVLIKGISSEGPKIQLSNPLGGSTWYLNQVTTGLNFGESGVADNRLFLANGGNVGIGTAIPNQALHVNGGTILTTAGAGAVSYRDIIIGNGSAGLSTGETHGLDWAVGTGTLVTIARIEAVFDGTGVNMNFRNFYSSGARSSILMTLLASGFFGINETSPGAQLQVNTNSSSTIGQIIKLAASASVDGFQLQKNDNTVYTSLSSVGLLNKYNSISTAGWGIPAVYGAGRSTAQTAAVASVAAYTVGAADGSFYISANANVTALVAGTFNVTVAYTDETNTAQTLKLNFSSVTGTIGIAIAATGPFEGIPAHIRAKASTTITIATSGTFTSITYNVEGIISQLQ